VECNPLATDHSFLITEVPRMQVTFLHIPQYAPHMTARIFMSSLLLKLFRTEIFCHDNSGEFKFTQK